MISQPHFRKFEDAQFFEHLDNKIIMSLMYFHLFSQFYSPLQPLSLYSPLQYWDIDHTVLQEICYSNT